MSRCRWSRAAERNIEGHGAGRGGPHRDRRRSPTAAVAEARGATPPRRRSPMNDRIEVVLIGSDSLETVRRTHANYFEAKVSTSKYLAGLETRNRHPPTDNHGRGPLVLPPARVS